MTAYAGASRRPRRRAASFLLAPFALLAGFGLAGAGLVAYLLWPTWSGAPVALDAPALPITVAGVLLEIPPAAIRVAVQRTPGPHERVDLAFSWPSLKPPAADPPPIGLPPIPSPENRPPAVPPDIIGNRLFVTVQPRGSELPPNARLRDIYPRYIEQQATAGPDGLAIVRFRTGTPYDGEDLIYASAAPDQFFALCTRQSGLVPGICIREVTIEAAEASLRFPRKWLEDWKTVAASFDRLVAQLHPPPH